MGYFNQIDHFSFAPQIAVLFPGSGLKLVGSLPSGDVTALLPGPLYDRVSGAGGKGLVVDKADLQAGNAISYKKLFAAAGSRAQIPFILGPLSLLPVVGNLITVITSAVDGLNRISATSVSAEQLAILMAEGGAFSKLYSISKFGGDSRLGISIVYGVNVGREARLYQIMSSAYAVSPAR